MDYLLAAVDLGSNSFRLSIGRVEQNNGKAQIYAVDRLKESVQLAAGLDAHQNLSASAVNRALAVLQRYGERLEGFHPNRVRAVATNTFRVARNVADILPRAEAALGFPIEVISGTEEARLIYSGVANELAPSTDRRLVIDIGGGSTEAILGRGHEPLHLASLSMGCVSFSRKYFPDGRITAQRMEQAMLAARGELQGIARRYRKAGWKQAYGSSGTAKGLLAILAETGMSQKGITLDGMDKLRAKLIKDGKVIMQNLPGIKATRAPVLPGGLAIMMAAFQELKIEYMLPGEGALRVGVLYDLLGRDSDHDKRDETATLYQKRYLIDVKQAERVRDIALRLFDQLGNTGDETDETRQALGWAASLHEVGLSITQANFNRHSAYILQHADMPGFSNDDQTLLAWLVLGQQGKLKKNGYPATSEQWQALLCLRLATLLCRRREDLDSLPLSVEIKDNAIKAKVAQSWLATHALSAYSLQREAYEWNKTDFSFRLIEQ
ncbi:MAG TPA: Ppx/GppA phosphatase family protein [Pusillimonas sp.]|uniref:Ppx/GppA phosphatase family protein n=1 Tax=Pusillimonas sp. TaxID=3040095 RepID=UPI002CE99606|nr:Ppx/GppA phosphatase family protein [Pusillimonas sp.]HUH88060.1 Ppx/GppA phosphatase family protein [Pusillimonas sp.]